MKNKHVVMITGPMYSGKTTLADYFVTKGYKKFSMAKSLKQLAADHYNNGEYLVKSENYAVYDKERGWIDKQGRTILQELSEAIKTVDYSWFYVNTALEIQKHYSDIIVIDDCRFEEEFLYFKAIFESVYLIYLKANREVQINRAQARDRIIPTEQQFTAVSEKFDWVTTDYANMIMENNGDNLNKFLGVFFAK